MIQVFGDIIVDDYIVGASTRNSPEADVPVVDYSNHYTTCGGVTIVAGVIDGFINDPSTSTLSTVCEDKPPKKTRIISNGSHMLRADTPRSNKHTWQNRDVKPSTKAVVLVDYDYGAITSSFVEELRKNKKLRVYGDSKYGFEKFIGCYSVKTNKKEFEFEFSVNLDANWLAELPRIRTEILKTEILIVTAGADGAYVCTDNACCLVPAKKVFSVDVSGAGDVFLGAFVSAMELEQLSPLDAVAFAVDVATDHVQYQHHHRFDVVVFTNGCFDILHPGHINLLKFCRTQGTKVIVGLNSNASVSRLKGKDRPVMPFSWRKHMLLALDCVDEVYEFDEDTPSELIDKLKPDVIVKGGDYISNEVVGADRCKVVIFPIVTTIHRDKISTSSIIERIKND